MQRVTLIKTTLKLKGVKNNKRYFKKLDLERAPFSYIILSKLKGRYYENKYNKQKRNIFNFNNFNNMFCSSYMVDIYIKLTRKQYGPRGI